MPQRSKKSRAALARNKQQIQNKIVTGANECQNDTSDVNDLAAGTENGINLIHTNENIQVDALGIKYIKRVQGNFHQGDFKQFSYESAGVQCSCNALVMLCKVDRIYRNLMSQHLDDVLRNGDKLYNVTARKLEACGELARDRTLDNYQLPKTVVLGDYQYTVKYDILRYGTFDEERESDLDTLEVEINRSFTVSERNILIFGGYMMALYKDNVTNQYLFFDSHSRDRSGYPSPDGAAVARIFPDINSLITFLHVLADNLNLNPRNFGIQPVTVTILENNTQRSTRHQYVQEKHQIRTNMCVNEDNEPRCSKLNSRNEPIQKPVTFAPNFHKQSTLNNSIIEDPLNSKIAVGNNRTLPSDKIYSSQPTSKQIKAKQDINRLSRYQKWLTNLPTSKRNDLLARKRKSSNECYASSPQKAKRQCKRAQQQSKVTYKDPEKGAKKREQEKSRYQKNPEIAARKSEQARRQSKVTYKDPEKGAKKREQARRQSKVTYKDPEKGAKKREQARRQSKVTYKDPQKGAEKREQEKTRYQKNPAKRSQKA